MALNMNQNDDLQNFISALEAGIRTRIADYPDATPIVDRIFTTLKNTHGIQGNERPARLPVCDHLENAFSWTRIASRVQNWFLFFVLLYTPIWYNEMNNAGVKLIQ